MIAGSGLTHASRKPESLIKFSVRTVTIKDSRPLYFAPGFIWTELMALLGSRATLRPPSALIYVGGP